MLENDTFDFLISDEDEVMLILEAQDIPPENPVAKLYPQKHIVEIYRSPEELLTLEGVDDDVFSKLKNKENILVCETADTENEDETEIVYAYEALIVE